MTSPVPPDAEAATSLDGGIAVTVAEEAEDCAETVGEIDGAVVADEGEEPHPAASTVESTKTNRVPQTVARKRGQRKRSAESFIRVIPSALLEVSDADQWGCPAATP